MVARSAWSVKDSRRLVVQTRSHIVVRIVSAALALLASTRVVAQEPNAPPTTVAPTPGPSAVPELPAQPSSSPASAVAPPVAPTAPTAPQPTAARPAPALADPNPPRPSHSLYIRHRFQLSYFGGWALHSHRVAELSYTGPYGTSGTSNVDAYFGGGLGGLFTYGLAFFDFLELDVSGGAQRSEINVSNAASVSNPPKGAFSRGAILIGPQVNIPLYGLSGPESDGGARLTLEGGLNIHGNPTLETDLSAIPGGTDTVLKYGTGVGWHGAVGVEGMGGKSDGVKLGVGLRLGYYAVNYALKSATESGVPIAKSNIASEFQKVSGDAINAMLYLAVFL
jgi:hypothetical protein